MIEVSDSKAATYLVGLAERIDELKDKNRKLMRVLAELTSSQGGAYELFRRPISSLCQLRPCVARRIGHYKIIVLGDLVRKTEADLLAIRWVGHVGLSEIKRSLASFGLHLGMTEEEIADWPPLGSVQPPA